MSSSILSRRFRNERGAVQVEFSIVLLCMLTVLFGIIEIGRLALIYTTLATAARAATRYAIVHGPDRSGTGADGPSDSGTCGSSCVGNSQVSAVASIYTTSAHMKASDVTVTVNYLDTNAQTNPFGNSIGSHVTVQVQYAYKSIVPLVPLTMTLGSTSEGVICF